MNTATILVVDDEPAIADMIVTALDIAGFRCLRADNAQQAHALVVDEQPDLVLLDWMMPGTSGLELARRLRRDDLTARIPLIMLTAKSEEDNRIQGLDAGADDYITKPFSTRELVARIKAVLRRTVAGDDEEPLVVGKLVMDRVARRVLDNGVALDLGPTEYRLLEFFMLHPERAYTRAQLLDHVWGGNVYIDERTVDVHIRRLRKALEPGAHDGLIQTVRGTGYRFSASN
ncbi:MAG TPA: phosphate regulon transcriptional regulator PhoB [Pseudomonadales bacterium]|nr:phosphate regulon transcriptional regulator PhoB [Pseudomonadales bacterium]